MACKPKNEYQGRGNYQYYWNYWYYFHHLVESNVKHYHNNRQENKIYINLLQRENKIKLKNQNQNNW